MPTKDEIKTLTRLEVAAFALEDQAANVASLATGLKLNGVVYSGTVVADASGVAMVNARSNFASVTVRPKESEATVTAGGSASSAPTSGPGVHIVPAGIERTVAIAGNVLVLYANPGTSISVQCWVHVQPPSSASTQPETCNASAPLRIAGANATTVLAVANPARRGLLIFHENPSADFLFLAYGVAASQTVYSVQIPGGGYYEIPKPFFRGQVNGIVPAALGFVMVTELTA